MAGPFEYFVILAEMRTGSNYLEVNLKDYPGLHCYGEAFNPNIMGKDKQTEMLGMSLQEREADPLALISLMKENSDGLPGFRFFHDHDPRVLSHCLTDRGCAKIVLTRNPVDTYISREIARQTNQWRLGDMLDAKSARVTFDREQFEEHLARHQSFQLEIQLALQTSGQTAYYIGYEDISNVDVLNGLARFLGVDEGKKRTSKKTKKQNPQSLEEKVLNHAEMETALRNFDYFALNRTPNFEPRRGPVVPSYLAAAKSPVLYMPIRSGPTKCISQWLADLDGVAQADLISGFTQKSLRKWKRQAHEHCSFTVIRHPVARLHRAFVLHILVPGPKLYDRIRETLRTVYNVPLPTPETDASYDAHAHRAAFLAFAAFVKGNLAGQTSIRVDGAWASQAELLQGMSNFMLPTHIFRENKMSDGLDYLARQLGRSPPKLVHVEENAPIALADIYDSDVEAAVRSAYQRDYMMFGFEPWRAPA